MRCRKFKVSGGLLQNSDRGDIFLAKTMYNWPPKRSARRTQTKSKRERKARGGPGDCCKIVIGGHIF